MALSFCKNTEYFLDKDGFAHKSIKNVWFEMFFIQCIPIPWTLFCLNFF